MSTVLPRRSDAAQNRERLIVEARAMFLAGTADVTLDVIAKAAGVGIGTLYRHFPTRETLIEAVYRLELDALEGEASDLLTTHSGFEAMRLWMDRYAKFVATKHAMHDALRVALMPRPGGASEIRTRINATIAKFIEAGSRDGTVRSDVRPDDVTLSMAGMVLAAATSIDPDQGRRLLDLLMTALKPMA